LQGKIKRLAGVKGRIVDSGSRAYVLQYAKKESLLLLPWLYYDPGVPCLERKRAQYHYFLTKID
jgi:hypothetical protein